jgi:hypothetical protein
MIDAELHETEVRIRVLADPLRKMADRHRLAGMARIADDLARAAQLAASGRLALSPTLSSMDEYMFMISTIRDAAARHGLVEPIKYSLPEEPPAPAGERIPDMVPPMDFAPTPIAAKPEGKRAKP